MNMEVHSASGFDRLRSIDPLVSRPTNKSRFRARTYALLLSLDLLSIAGVFLLVSYLRLGSAIAVSAMNVMVPLIPLYVLIAANRNIYCADFFYNWKRNAFRSLAALGTAGLAVLFVGFYLKASAEMSREIFTVSLSLGAFMLVVVRWTLHRHLMWATGGETITRVVISDGVQIPLDDGAVMIDAEVLGLRPNEADPRVRDRLGRLVQNADRVIVTCGQERREAWAALLKGCGVQGEIMVPELGNLGVLGSGSHGGCPTLIVSRGTLRLHDRLIKRMIDTAIAGFALGLLAPLMIFVAFAIKIDSPGPVFFVQPRLGRGNRLFSMYKFRSMRSDLCDLEGKASTQRDDRRITRVGRIIRATSFDELPQLINVLKGDMSVVGPRPHALGSLAENQLFWEVDERYWNRHAAKPGITGLAQVRGFRGATHVRSDLINRLQADLEYLNGWTVWRDLRILVATAKVLLHRNAY